MANLPKRNTSSNPNNEGTPLEHTPNGYNQWVTQAINDLRSANAKSQDDLIQLLSELHNKIDTNHKSVSDKIAENNKLFEDKIELRHSLIEVKIKNVSDGIENKHALACEIMKNIEPSIINKINSEQKSFNRWMITLSVGAVIGIAGILIKMFVK